MFQGPQTSWRENALQDPSGVPHDHVLLWRSPWENGTQPALTFWVRIKNKKALWEGSRGLQLDEKRAGVDSIGPRAWQGQTARHCPRHQCVRSQQSRAQLRPFINKYCFRPKCVDLRKLHLSLAMQIVLGGAALQLRVLQGANTAWNLLSSLVKLLER